MKKLLIIVISILAILLVLSFIKDTLIKISVEKGVELVTGLQLKMRSLNVGIIKTLVGIKNLTLLNPKGYTDKIMLDMPEIYVDYDLPSIIKGRVHLEEMRINLKEFTVVKNEKGEINLNSLKVIQSQKEGKKPGTEERGKVPEIQIDSLELKVGKVIYKDYSRGATPVVKEFNIDINEKYENITNPYSLVTLILVKSLTNTTIASLTNIDLRALQGTISETLATAQKLAGETAAQAQEAVKQATMKAQEATKEATESLKETAEGLKDKFKLPFGDK